MSAWLPHAVVHIWARCGKTEKELKTASNSARARVYVRARAVYVGNLDVLALSRS